MPELFTDFNRPNAWRRKTPEGSMGVVVTLKSKMAASSASSGENGQILVLFDPSNSSNKSPEPLLDGPATSEHILALPPFFRFGEIRRHIGFVRDYNYHIARSNHESIVFKPLYIRSILFKVYMKDFFLFARSILSEMLLSTWKDFFRNLFFRLVLAV